MVSNLGSSADQRSWRLFCVRELGWWSLGGAYRAAPWLPVVAPGERYARVFVDSIGRKILRRSEVQFTECA